MHSSGNPDFYREHINDIVSREEGMSPGSVGSNDKLIVYLNLDRVDRFWYRVGDFLWFLLSRTGSPIGRVAVQVAKSMERSAVQAAKFMRDETLRELAYARQNLPSLYASVRTYLK